MNKIEKFLQKPIDNCKSLLYNRKADFELAIDP